MPSGNSVLYLGTEMLASTGQRPSPPPPPPPQQAYPELDVKILQHLTFWTRSNRLRIVRYIYTCLLPSPFTSLRILFALSILFIGLKPFFSLVQQIFPLRDILFFYSSYLFHYSNLILFCYILLFFLCFSVPLFSTFVHLIYFIIIFLLLYSELLCLFLTLKYLPTSQAFFLFCDSIMFCNLLSRSFPFVLFRWSILLFSSYHTKYSLANELETQDNFLQYSILSRIW